MRELALLGVHRHRWPLRALVRARGQLALLRRPRVHVPRVGHQLDVAAAAQKRSVSNGG